MTIHAETAGSLLRSWRQRRRLSQLALAADAELSTRHLSFVESGRATASRAMLLRLAEHLAMPLRERNRLLLAGGFAPVHAERPLNAPDMEAARRAVDGVLAAHAPFPALAIDRHWTLLAANAAVAPLLEGVVARLLEPPINVLRLSLHPDGLAPRIENLAEWRRHLLQRLRVEVAASNDAVLVSLLEELSALPVRAGGTPPRLADAIAVPLTLREPRGGTRLSFLATTTVFGTATDVTLSEIALECLFPADEATRAFLVANPIGTA